MIIIFTHIKFSRIYSPARNARKYVLRENVYVYSRSLYVGLFIFIKSICPHCPPSRPYDVRPLVPELFSFFPFFNQ